MPISNYFDPTAIVDSTNQFAAGLDIPAQNIQRAATNLEAIRKSKADRENQRALLDLEKRKQEIAVEEAHQKGELTGLMRQQIEAQIKAQQKQQADVLDAHDTIADASEHEHTVQLKQGIGMFSKMLKDSVASAVSSPAMGDGVNRNYDPMNPPRPTAIPNFNPNDPNNAKMVPMAGGNTYPPASQVPNSEGKYTYDQSNRGLDANGKPKWQGKYGSEQEAWDAIYGKGRFDTNGQAAEPGDLARIQAGGGQSAPRGDYSWMDEARRQKQEFANPSIPVGGRVPAREQVPPQYEPDLTTTLKTGQPTWKESASYTDYIKNKSKEDKALTVNALKIDAEDLQLLDQVYQARKSGQDVSKEEILSQLTPETATSIQGLIDYNDDPKTYSSRNNARVEAIRMARMVDPSYDPTKYEERKKYRIELASESSLVGKQKIALNTVAQHIQQLDGYVDALGGGNIKPVNMVINFAKDITGNPAIATYEQAHEAVMSEMQRLLTGVGVTQSGMAEARKIVDRNTGYEAKKAAIKSLVKIVEGRISPLRQSFKGKMGREESGEILFPESKAIFDKYLNSEETKPTEQEWKASPGGAKYRILK